jgi:hypothetical protein
MSESDAIEVSRADIASLEAKLAEVSANCSPQEQAVLAWLLDRAAAAGPIGGGDDGEVRGYLGAGAYEAGLQLGAWSGAGNGALLGASLGLPGFDRRFSVRGLDRSIILVGG